MVKRTTKSKSTSTYEIDPELLNPKYNEVRKPSLPYAIVINDQDAGILIPQEQLVKAEWLNIPPEDELTTVELTEEVTGVFLQKCRFIVLAFVPEYVRWKDVEENNDQAGTFIGLYDDYRHRLDKKTQEVCSEHALVFLNEKNQPLHKLPIVVRFRNVSLWSFKSAREDFYRSLEKVFADYCDQEYSGKSNKWRSLGVLEVEFKGIKEGEGKNKSYCCKTYRITPPTQKNLPRLFLGTPKRKKQVWKLHNNIAGFVESSGEQLPALASSGEPEVEVLEKESNNGRSRKMRKIDQVEVDEDLDDLDDFDEELEELDDFEEELE
jgi:hypothetical protein